MVTFLYDAYSFGRTLYFINNETNARRFLEEVSTIKSIAKNTVYGDRSGQRFMNAVNHFCRSWGTEMLPNDVRAAVPEFAARAHGIELEHHRNDPNVITMIRGPCMDPNFPNCSTSTGCTCS